MSKSQGKNCATPELSVRKAHVADHCAIATLLESLDLGYPAADLSCFWVAESAGALVAVAELKEGRNWSLLSCVGVHPEVQGRGIGRLLVDALWKQARSPVYLYTLVPEFFRKVGFGDPTSLPKDLPTRDIYGCAACSPLLCRCLVRPRDDS